MRASIYRGTINSLGRGVMPFDPESIFANGEVGDYWETGDLSTLFQNSNGTGAVASDGDPIGRWNGKRGLWYMAQANAGQKPIWDLATKSVKSFDAKFLTNTPFALPVGIGNKTDFSWVSFHKRSGVEAAWNYGYFAVTRTNGYGWALGMLSSNIILPGSGASNAGYANTTGLPGTDEFALRAFVQSATSAETYAGADGLNRNVPPTAQSLAPQQVYGDGVGDFLCDYTDESGRYYHRKFLLLVRRALTPEEIIGLAEYAGALP